MAGKWRHSQITFKMLVTYVWSNEQNTMFIPHRALKEYAAPNMIKHHKQLIIKHKMVIYKSALFIFL
jgi:hypothetical protein